MHRSLKRGDLEAVAREWHEHLASLVKHYDDTRMLYYIGRFGLRPAYTRACDTMGYLRGMPPEILRTRLSIFRYAVEHSTMKTEAQKAWMIGDLAKMLKIDMADFPAADETMTEALAAAIAKANPKK